MFIGSAALAQSETSGNVKEQANKVYEAAKDKSREGAGWAKEKGDAGAKWAKGKAGQAKSYIADSSKGIWAKTKNKGSELMRKGKEKVPAVFGKAKNYLSNAYQKVKEKFTKKKG